MADTTVLGIDYIVKTPGVLGGDPRIAGRRIGVRDVVESHLHNGTPVEEIARAYDLTLAQIYAALAYYYDHREEVDAIIEENQRIYEAHRDDERTFALRAKFEARKAEGMIEMTATEIAEEFGITTRAVRKAAEAGAVPARKSGATWLIRRADAEARWGKRKQSAAR